MKTDELELQFNQFNDSLHKEDYTKQNWDKIQDWLHFFEGGVYNIKGKHFELAYIALCSVVEAIAVNKYKKQIRKEDNPLFKFLRCLAIAVNIDILQKKFGITNRFVKVIVDYYQGKGELPSFMRYKLKMKGGITSVEDASYNSLDEAYEELSKVLKNVYRKFRSDPAHEAIRLNFETEIMCRMGDASSIPGWLRVQNFGAIVLDLMKSRAGELKKS
ncbi:MAG: hypothetical protein KJ955_02000 [Nanoarchaeota archaeon]|nr:hypothetical protein [Nanoarchaeota archaeon]